MVHARVRRVIAGAVLALTSFGVAATPASPQGPAVEGEALGAPTASFTGSKGPTERIGASRAVGDVTISSQGCTPTPVAFGGQTTCGYAVQNQTQTATTVDLVANGDAELRVVGADQGAVTNGGIATADDVPLPPRGTSPIQVNPGSTPAGYTALASAGIAATPIADDQVINFPTPEFRWNGVIYDDIGVSANGYLVVGGADTAKDATATPQDVPNPGRPNNVLAPFWTDLTTAGGGELRAGYVTASGSPVGNRPVWIVVEWDLFEFGTATRRKAQVWIESEDPEVPAPQPPPPAEAVYFTYDHSTMTATPARPFRIAAENSTGTVGGMRPAGELPTQNYRVTSSGTAQPAPVVHWDVVAEGVAAGTGTIAATASSSLIPGSTTVFTDVTVEAETAPVITDHPDDRTVTATDQAVFSAAASGATSVRWQRSTDDGGTWDDVPGATATTLTVDTTGANDGDQFRAVFANGSGVESTTNAATLVVLDIVTTTTVTASPAAPAVGEAVTFTASVFPPGGTGTVQFAVDGVPLGGAEPLINDQATSESTTTLAPGDHTVTATYSGDLNRAGSTGTGGVSVGKTETTTSVAVAPADPIVGEDVTFTATVSPSPAPGTVQFTVDGTALGGPVAVSGGTAASPPLSGLERGSHVVVAAYSGDATRAMSTSGPVTFEVERRATVTEVSANPPDPDTDDEVILQATVSYADDGTVAGGGTVQFVLDGNPVGAPVAYSGGDALLLPPLTDLAAGDHTIAAVTSGNDTDAPSTSPTVTLTVDKRVSSTDLSALEPEYATVGDDFSLLLTVAPAPTGGTVQMSVDGTPVGAPVAIGGASPLRVDLAGLPEGNHTIGAAFSGDDELLPSDTTYALTVYTEDEAFVRKAFLVVLGRAADPGAVGYWTGLLDGGMSREVFTRRLAESAEGRARLVELSYERAFGRRADVDARAYWSGRLAGGMTAEDLLATLIASAEGYQRSGSSPQGTALTLFRVHTGRGASTQDLDHWTARVDAANTPAGRRQVALAFGRSSEATSVAVRRAVVAACGDPVATGPETSQLTSRWAPSGRHPLRLAGSALAIVCPPGAP